MAKQQRKRRTKEEIEKGITLEQINSQEELKQKHKENTPKGLGDKIEEITEKTGIKKLVKWVAGDDCGCDERKENFNKIDTRLKIRPECLTVEEHNWLVDYFNKDTKVITASENLKINEIYGRVFRKKVDKSSSCSGCMAQRVNDLREVLNIYQ